MRNRFVKTSSPAVRLHLWLVTLIAGSAVVLDAADEVQRLPAKATVSFAGTSTLHDFSGHLPALPFFIVISNGTWSASGDVLSGQMATASEKRDHNMHRMLGTNDYPRIHGEVAGAPIPGSTGTNATLRFKLRDKVKDLPVRITAWKDTTQELRFHAEWELSLKEFGLKPPSVAAVIRVGDKVKLEADVTASKTAPPKSPPSSQ